MMTFVKGVPKNKCFLTHRKYIREYLIVLNKYICTLRGRDTGVVCALV